MNHRHDRAVLRRGSRVGRAALIFVTAIVFRKHEKLFAGHTAAPQQARYQKQREKRIGNGPKHRRSTPEYRKAPVCCNAQRKNPDLSTGAFLINWATSYSPTHLARAVPSGLKGLTSVFGMGTGGTPSLGSPKIAGRNRPDEPSPYRRLSAFIGGQFSALNIDGPLF